MRVVIMGGGVVGVTTAYQLQNDGCEVVLLERHPSVAEEASWGNAGMIAPGHCFAWSSPSAPMTLMKSLVLKDQALRFRPSLDPDLWRWSWLFLKECTEAKARANTLRKHRLAVYSQAVLHEVLAAEQIDYDRNARGILYFHRTQAALDLGAERMRLLGDAGQEIRILDRGAVIALEPSLGSASGEIAGGIYCPTDETGDANKFSRALAAICRDRGAEIHTSVTIRSIETDGDKVRSVTTDKGPVRGDVYVLALGSHSPKLARTIGVRLPVYPIKGYSLTIPIGNHARPPSMGLVDEQNLVAISRFGDRIRVTATAEFAGYDTGHKPEDFRFMKQVAEGLFPEGGDYARAKMWAGLRPMTPDNLPIFGRQRYRNLVFNTGHGHIGWTMSHGSARITADLIAGRTPAIADDAILAA
jgi:D-amino-acid dehydrogenase